MARRRLTQQQRRRIAENQAKRRAQLQETPPEPDERDASQAGLACAGRVITRHGRHLAVSDAEGRLHHCQLRQSIGEPVCGDNVVWHPTTPGQGVVSALLERRSVLTRPTYGGIEKALAANIDQLVIVLAAEPPPSAYLLDQYLVAAESLGVEALITLNKADLLDRIGHAAFSQQFGHYRDIGYPLIEISARLAHGLDPLIARLQGHTSILVGQSGVGKSSLAKALLPDIEIQTGRLSATSGLGRHTTSTTTLYRLPDGGELIDSPGVRSFRLGRLDVRALEHGFREFHDYLGRCRFSDCSHDHEPGCALLDACEAERIYPLRLVNFRHMVSTLDKTR